MVLLEQCSGNGTRRIKIPLISTRLGPNVTVQLARAIPSRPGSPVGPEQNAQDATERKIPSKGSCLAAEGEVPPSPKEALPNGQRVTGRDTEIRNQGKTTLRLKSEPN